MRASVHLVALLYGVIAVAFVFEVANAGCPMKNIGRRSLLQSPTAAPAPSMVPDTYLAPPLQYGFYDQTCPGLRQLVKDKIAAYTLSDAITPAPLLRLFFHDCFTTGCDGSLLLNSTVLNLAEKDQAKSSTLDRFYIIDDIKATLEAGMCNNTVSCADILALTAVTSVELAGGPVIDIGLGRRDALDSFAAAAQTNMPGGFLHVQGLLESFLNVGLTVTDLVALSGAHTIGQTHCSNFADRFASTINNPFPDVAYGKQLYDYCTEGGTVAFGAVDKKMNLDSNSATTFDNGYFMDLVNGRGVLTSDHDLIVDIRTSALVKLYAANQTAFFNQFATSIRQMGKINVLTGTQGQIRKQCWVRNQVDAINSPFSDFDFNPISPLICKPATCPVAPACST